MILAFTVLALFMSVALVLCLAAMALLDVAFNSPMKPSKYRGIANQSHSFVADQDVAKMTYSRMNDSVAV